ncbi:MAG TPA: MFS transporter [Candidatus Limnocylindrales bacterium]|nr:MFS transporter [Candidatus Limnocylindrales bacterium]
MSLAAHPGVRALRHHNYRLFFNGQLISLIGTWTQQVGEAWLVLQLTHDPLWLGIVSVAQFGPVIAFGLFGGVIADHLPKRRTLMATQSVAMTLAFILFGLSATGVIQVWHILIIAMILGFANAIDMPTRQSFAVEMVGRDDVANAVGLNSAVFNAARIVGPAVGGILIGVFGVPIAYLINGLSFIAVISAYRLMRDTEMRAAPRPDRPKDARDVLHNLQEGVHYVRSTPMVLLAASTVGLVATFGMNFSVLVPPLADHVLVVGATGYGFLMAASGVGSTGSALSIAFTARPSPRVLAIGAMALGVGSLILAWSRAFPLSLLAMLICGAGGVGMAVTANTTIQLNVPDNLRGRVMSVYTTIFAGSVPAGGLVMGAIGSSMGVPSALAIGGVLSVITAVGSWLWLNRILASRRPSLRELAGSATAAADIGAIDPEGRSAGTLSGSSRS